MKSIQLNGKTIRINDILSIGKEKKPVNLSIEGVQRAARGHDILLAAAQSGMPIYGLTTGVGWNKDRPVFGENGKLDPELIYLSECFNKNLVYSHSAAVGDFMPLTLVRMAMAIRLNQFLTGHTGVSAELICMYQTFLNHDITPLVPQGGSVGAADILPAAHMTLAMIGEWDVIYQEKRQNAKMVLDQLNIKPLKLFAKDALSSFSHNALLIAYSIDIIDKIEHLLSVSPKVVALSLEGMNGNISPYLEQTISQRAMPNISRVAEQVLSMLEGSFLWQADKNRVLQDPLSLRGAHWAIAAAQSELISLHHIIDIHINSSDDNPVIIQDNRENKYYESSQVKSYEIHHNNTYGAIYPSANFESVQIVIKLQSLGVAIAHICRDAVYRTLKLSDPKFTQLSRFLMTADNKGHGFGAIQHSSIAFLTELRSLINPCSLDGIAAVGEIEDTYSNGMLVGQKLLKGIDNSYYILAIELLHSTQAIDLRLTDNNKIIIGKKTQLIKDNFRKQIKFFDKDRPISIDIELAKQFIEYM
nr:aromatic amino acid ammonia-lyase [uncultured Moellerella sp.]